MKIILLALCIIFNINMQAQTVSDIDGNVYNTVVIGSQTWMKENLKVVRYQNGDSIATTFPASKNITQEQAPKYQWTYDGIDSNAINYGRLYTWFTIADARQVCPVDWHIPSDQEWDSLIAYLGGIDNAAPEFINGDFSAVYAGRRHINGSFNAMDSGTYWWSSGDFLMNSYWKPALTINGSDVQVFGNLFRNRSLGFSVRCIKDNTTSNRSNVNPNHHYLIIDHSNNKIIINPKNITNPILYIYNLQGQLILRKEIKNGASSINIDHLFNALYIVQLVGTNFTIQNKLMKIK